MGQDSVGKASPGEYAHCADEAAIQWVGRIGLLDRVRKNRYEEGCTQFSDPLSPTCLTVLFSPRAFRAVDHTLTHVRRTVTSPSRRPGHSARAPPTSPTLALPPLSSHPHSSWAHPGTTEQLTGPKGGREGAVLGSDGQSGRPIEPGTASPKGGRGGSDGPNEQGARVGLPPGIPLARIAGLWVTRKLGGRWRRQPRLGGRVSDTGPSSRKRSRGSRGSRLPAIHPRPRPLAEARAGARVPLLGAHPLLLVATESRGGSRCEGRGAAGAGLRAPPGAAEPKSGEEEKRQAASGDRHKDRPLGSMRRAPSRARALAESQPCKSLAEAAQAASMAARPAARGG